MQYRSLNFLYIIVASCVILLIATSCGGSKTVTGNGIDSSKVDNADLSLPNLPSPSQLDGMAGLQKNASYTEPGLVNTGSEFNTMLPNELVSSVGSGGRFQPSWTTGTTGLSYAIYTFDISGIDREAIISYGFNTPPSDSSCVWFGVADYNKNNWNWYACNLSRSINLVQYTEYTSPTDYLHVAVVVTGDTPVQLSFIRLGEQRIVPDLSISPDKGLTPVQAMLDASGSTASYSVIAKYEWDIDGDGVFDVDTGTTPEYQYTYADAGILNPSVRVTNSLGEYGIASSSIEVKDDWTHSWGTSNSEYFWDIAIDSEEAIYCLGTTNCTGSADILLVKFSIDGEVQWAKVWDAPGNEFGYSIDLDNTSIYVAGLTDSYFASGNDMLVQRWDRDGNVVWTRTFDYENNGYDEAQSIDVYGGSVYVAGRLSDTSTIYGGDGALISFDQDGELNWARTFGGPNGEGAACVSVSQILPHISPVINVCGWSNDYGFGEVSLLYAKYNTSGTMTDFRSWGRPNTRTYPKQVNIGMLLTPSYIIGSYQDESSETGTFLMQLQGSNDPYAYVYKPDSYVRSLADGMVIIDDFIYLSGHTHEPYGFILKLAITGTIQTTTAWDKNSPDISPEFHGLAKYPENGGLIIPGTASYSDGRIFHYEAFSQTSLPTTSWSDMTLEQKDVSGVITSPTAGSVDVTDQGTIDTGGGGADAILLTKGFF